MEDNLITLEPRGGFRCSFTVIFHIPAGNSEDQFSSPYLLGPDSLILDGLERDRANTYPEHKFCHGLTGPADIEANFAKGLSHFLMGMGDKLSVAED